MALLNKAEIVQRAFTEGAIQFNEAYGALLKPTGPWSEFTSIYPCNTETVDFSFVMDVPLFREMIGPVAFADIAAKHYTRTMKNYGAGIKMHKNDINDDILGIIIRRIRELAETPREAQEFLAFDALDKGIAATVYGACYDGRPFFDNTHPLFGATASNYLAGGGQPEWYLLDCSKAWKPIVLAMREEGEFEQESMSSSHYFETGECRFKAEGRMCMGYGMWQLAFCETHALADATFWGAIQLMRQLTNDKGRPLGVFPTHLVVTPAAERTARELLMRNYRSDAAGATITATVSNEPIRSTGIKLIVSPYVS